MCLLAADKHSFLMPLIQVCLCAAVDTTSKERHPKTSKDSQRRYLLIFETNPLVKGFGSAIEADLRRCWTAFRSLTLEEPVLTMFEQILNIRDFSSERRTQNVFYSAITLVFNSVTQVNTKLVPNSMNKYNVRHNSTHFWFVLICSLRCLLF